MRALRTLWELTFSDQKFDVFKVGVNSPKQQGNRRLCLAHTEAPQQQGIEGKGSLSDSKQINIYMRDCVGSRENDVTVGLGV